MADIAILYEKTIERFGSLLQHAEVKLNELTLDVAPQHLIAVCTALKEEDTFDFQCLIDVCGIDYLHFGVSEWETESATARGFERGVDKQAIQNATLSKHRFASVYHLLSLRLNHRLRIRVFLNEAEPKVPSLLSVWPSANWFEREAFDLFGIMYEDHPDLRRLLTDYGFVGHPFRKDFPLIGNVEARYDAALGRVIYEPVSIEPRILEPKVIRGDSRYQVGE